MNEEITNYELAKWISEQEEALRERFGEFTKGLFHKNESGMWKYVTYVALKVLINDKLHALKADALEIVKAAEQVEDLLDGE